MLGVHFCARAFSSCGERGPLFIAVRGPLTVVASLVAEHRLQTRRLSSCGSWAQLLRGMWDLPRPGSRARTRVPCIGRQILNHCATREALNLFFIEVQLIYNVVLISAVQQSDSVIHIHTFFFNIVFHYGLSQGIGYSSLCYTVEPGCLSILNLIVCTY